MDKETFDLYLGQSRKIQQDRVRFFQIQFAELSKKKIQNFHCMFDMNVFSRGQTIFLEDEKADYFQIVKSGEVGMYKFDVCHLKHRSKLISMTEPAKERKELQKYYEFDDTGIYAYKKPVEPSSKHIVLKEKAIPISILEALSFFGEECLLYNSSDPSYVPRYNFTAVALQEGTTVFSLHKSKFDLVQSVIGGYAFTNLQNTGKVHSTHQDFDKVSR